MIKYNVFVRELDLICNRVSDTSNSVTHGYSLNALNQYDQITNGGVRNLAYDLDGNLTNDSVFAYVWDSENRVVGVNGGGIEALYRYDYMGRRTSHADSGHAFAAQPTYGDSSTVEMPAYNAYSYNTRSEVTGAARRWGTPGASGDLVLGQQYAYDFDSIGNRITSAEGDTDRAATYTANALNQYTQRTVPDEKDLIGTAPTNVAVTVNSAAVTRQNAYWHHALEVTNTTSAAYPQVAVTAVYNPPGTNDPDVVTSQTGRVFMAKTPEAFTYDDDGNLTQDGRFGYTWNGENRLIKAETRDDLTASVPRVKVDYAYDHQGRMVWKQISTNAIIASTRTLVWDGYNIVRSLTHSQTHTLTNYYTWGLDLSGSLQGAGGVGGLLVEVQNGVPYFAAFDANGNVTEYLGTDGTIAAHYEYNPFGETVVQSGALNASFTHRFSTKPWCAVTGLSEYEFRKYSPPLGRWLSRDPIEEDSESVALLTTCGNMLTCRVDPFGLWSLKRLDVMHDSYSKVLEEDFRSLEKDIMPGLKLDIDRVIARAEALPKRCQYRKALFKGLKRVKQTLDEIGSMLSSDEPLNLSLKGRYGRPNPDPPSARTWKSWGTWEMEFNMDDGLYFPQERKQRLGTLFHEHVHVVEGNNQHKGFWDNPYYLAFMVKSEFESFTTAVRSKMVAEEGDECCPTGRDEWPNNP